MTLLSFVLPCLLLIVIGAYLVLQRPRGATKISEEEVLDSLEECLLVVDEFGIIIRSNAALTQITGLPATRMEGKRVEHVLKNAKFLEFAQSALAAEQPSEAEVIFFTPEEKIFRVYAKRLNGAESGSMRTLLVFKDISDLRRLERVRRDFVANVSHELRTPMTSIKGSAETLLDGALSDPVAAKNFVEMISRQSERVQAIVEDLLILSRIEGAGEELPTERCDISEMIAHAAEDWLDRARAKGVSLTLSVPEKVVVQGNATLLEQVFTNLLENAYKACRGEGEVVFEIRRVESQYIVMVIDNGCGIGSEHLSRLFERFYTVDAARSRKEGGTGLGLSIVKHIVQAHGGRVAVTSALNKGSQFSVYLPG